MSVKLNKNSIKVGRKEIKDLLPAFLERIQAHVDGFISEEGVFFRQEYGNVEVYQHCHSFKTKNHLIQVSFKVEQSEFT